MKIKSLLLFLFLISAFFSFSQTIIPFHLVDGFILINAEVNGKKGKLLFDTGTENDFFLNNHQLSLEKNQFITKGEAQSGQKLEIYSSPVESIVITASAIHFSNLKNVWHTNFSFMEEGIAADILGTIGYGVFKNYVFSIDYNRQLITLYSNDQKPPENGLEIPIELPADQPNMPYIKMKIGKSFIAAYFDTGNQGSLQLTQENYDVWKKKKLLIEYSKNIWYGEKTSDDENVFIPNITFDKTNFSIENLNLKISNQNKIGLGYSFLKNYISVWDYHRKTITLIKN